MSDHGAHLCEDPMHATAADHRTWEKKRESFVQRTFPDVYHRLTQWHSPRCQHFYGRVAAADVMKNANNLSTLCNTPPIVFEKLATGRRIDAYRNAMHNAQDILVSDRYKIIVIANRKSGSTSTYQLLQKNLGASLYSCFGYPARQDPRQCKFSQRCTSECLTSDMAREYVVFFSVRDPVERFFSAYQQSMIMYKNTTTSVSEMRQVLQDMLTTHRLWEHHLETQSGALSTPTASGFMLPLHYLGTLPTLQQDLLDFLQLAAYNLQMQSASSDAQALLRIADEIRAIVDKGGLHERSRDQHSVTREPTLVDDPVINERVRLVYAMDLACFGK